MENPAMNEQEEFEFRHRLEQEQQTQPKQSLWEKAKASASAALSVPGATGGPLSLPAQGQDVVNKGFHRLGTRVAEGLAQNGANFAPFGAPARPSGGIDPRVAAGLGLAVSMTPDIVSSVGPAEAIDISPEMAKGPARRALGFSKAMLKTPTARREAANAAQIALKENVIPGLGSPNVMMSRATQLAGKTGNELGGIRSSIGPQTLDEVSSRLENLRNIETGGARGGVFDRMHTKIDEAVDSIQAIKDKISPPERLNKLNPGNRSNPLLPAKPAPPTQVPLQEIENLKKNLSDTVNWINDNATQKITKKIVSNIERGVEDILGKNGIDLDQYRSLKKTYGAAKGMQKGLNNEIAAQEGNMAASLPSFVMGAGKKGPQALIDMLITEGLKRRGAGITAANLNKAIVPLAATNPLLFALRKKNKT